MNKLKKVLSFFLVVIMVIGLFPQGVMAKSYRLSRTEFTLKYKPEVKSINTYIILSSKESTKITKVVLKDKKLANVTVTNDKKGISIEPKKVGNTTLTVYVKYGSKTDKHKMKLKIGKYTNPLKKFKIGGVNYKNNFSGKTISTISVPKKEKRVKLEVAAKKGYKISSVKYAYTINNQRKTVMLKNNKKFKLYPSNGCIYIWVKENKTADTDCFMLRFYNFSFQLKPA